MSDYRPVHSRPKESNGSEPERHRLEFVSSPDSAALSEIVSLLAQTLNDFRAWAAENQRYQAEQRGAMARVQIPTPHVAIEAAKAPDVTVEPPPPADVTVHVPEAQVTVESAPPRNKRVVLHRDARGFLESADIEEQ